MKKILFVFGAFALAFAATAELDTLITFSTKGPDTYLDGKTVMDGECYALVWTKTGSTFAGLNADGTCVDPENNALVLAAPIAKGDILGSVTVSLGEKILFSSGLTASRDVEEFRPEDHPTPLPSPTPSPVIPEQEPARELDSHTLMILMVLALLVILLIVASALLFVHIRRNRSR